MTNQTTLTKREAIAASALQGLIAAFGTRQDANILLDASKKTLAKLAVQYADELLAALGAQVQP